MRSTQIARGRLGRAMGLMVAATTVAGMVLATCGIVLFITAAPASAHQSPITITCDTITVNYSAFPTTGTNSATVTINGAPRSFTWTGATHTFSTPRPAGAVTVTTNWTGSDGLTGSMTNTDSGADCGTTTTTTSTSTTSTSTTSAPAPTPTTPPAGCTGPPVACSPQVTPTTVSPTVPPTTLQVVPAVQPETAPATPTTSAGSTVGAGSAVSAGSATTGAELASTGTDPRGLTCLGLVLAGVGLALVGLTGRRRWLRNR